MRRGLVLSGGGALGAYQAGVLRALHQAGIEFDVISATSIGTINAAAWNIHEVIESLDEHWLENVSELKPFSADRLLRGRNPFQFHKALERLVDRYRVRYPFEDQRAEVLVTVTDYEASELRVFSTADNTLSQEERELSMKASTAILHIGSTPVEIRGRRYYDGGYHRNVPLEPLLERSLDEIWVIPLTPVQGCLGSHRRMRRLSVKPLQQALPFAYTHSLLGFAGQLLVPPDMERGPARKIIISPYRTGAFRPSGLGQALLFSPDNIQALLDHGWRDGQRAIAAYQPEKS